MEIYAKQTKTLKTKTLHTKKTDILTLLGLPTMHGLLRQKRMRWVGHALRRADSDLSKVEVKKEMALSSKPWTKCLLRDMKELNIKSIKALEDNSEKRELFRKISTRTRTVAHIRAIILTFEGDKVLLIESHRNP